MSLASVNKVGIMGWKLFACLLAARNTKVCWLISSVVRLCFLPITQSRCLRKVFGYLGGAYRSTPWGWSGESHPLCLCHESWRFQLLEELQIARYPVATWSRDIGCTAAIEGDIIPFLTVDKVKGPDVGWFIQFKPDTDGGGVRKGTSPTLILWS